MTYRELLRFGEDVLREGAVQEAETDAWLLFEFATGIDRTHYFLRQQDKCEDEEQTRFSALLARRAEHVPLQYLTGRQAFMGLSFLVNESVLIPRQDTELLVLEAERQIKEGDRVLDVCTGSGCIIISLAKRRHILAHALDISEMALAVARENARRLGAEVTFFSSDLFAQATEKYDVIVSNPPYIKSGDIPSLMPEVAKHEPRLALDGHADGLHFYRRIAREAALFLNPGGRLLFEIGFDQGRAVSALLRGQGYADIEVKKDLAGHDRVVSGRLP